MKLKYIFRPKKMGIGSAHKDGIIWAYKKNYETNYDKKLRKMF